MKPSCLFILFILLFSGIASAGRGYPPIFNAVYNNDMVYFKSYVESNKDINVRLPKRHNRPGDSLLLATIDNSRVEMVAILLQNKVNIEMGHLEHALGRGEAKIFKLFYPFIQKLDQQSLNELLINASTYCYKDYLSIVETLLSFGAQADAQVSRNLEGSFTCIVTPVSAVQKVLNDKYATDAQGIYNILIETIQKTTGYEKSKILEPYIKEPQKYDCGIHD